MVPWPFAFVAIYFDMLTVKDHVQHLVNDGRINVLYYAIGDKDLDRSI